MTPVWIGWCSSSSCWRLRALAGTRRRGAGPRTMNMGVSFSLGMFVLCVCKTSCESLFLSLLLLCADVAVCAEGSVSEFFMCPARCVVLASMLSSRRSSTSARPGMNPDVVYMYAQRPTVLVVAVRAFSATAPTKHNQPSRRLLIVRLPYSSVFRHSAHEAQPTTQALGYGVG